jgi:radical SAM superfamily enzyme YgiQ (UPF0313 family)
MKKKVLLLTPPCPQPGQSPLHAGDCRPPQGLGFIAAYLQQAGHETKIVDLYQFDRAVLTKNACVVQEDTAKNLNIDLAGQIEDFRPDYIGMYIHTMSYYKACELGQYLKDTYPNIILICGGPHPTVLPRTVPSCFDHVVIGAGEIIALEIVEGRVNERIVRGIEVDNLDELCWPNYDWFIDKPYNWGLDIFGCSGCKILPLSTSRGCPYSCTFCGVKKICGNRYSCVSAGTLFQKVVQLRNKYQLDGFYFREDNFTANTYRLHRFCDLLMGHDDKIVWAAESRVRELSAELIEKMARSGCVGLYIGVESGSPRMLEHIKKQETIEDFLEKFPLLHRAGIKTYTTWMVGLPTETQEDRQQNDVLMQQLKPDACDRFVYIGIPKSEIYEYLDAEKAYEFKEPNGIIYPRGYLSLSQELYGKDDPRHIYVQRLYSSNNISPIDIDECLISQGYSG